MFIEVRLTTDVRPSAVIVPEEAIVPLEGLVIAWVVTAEGTVERREVTLGVRTPGFVEIRSGIDGNEQVVVGVQVRLQPGMPLMQIPVDRPAPSQEGGTDAAPGGQPGDGAGAVSPDSGV